MIGNSTNAFSIFQQPDFGHAGDGFVILGNQVDCETSVGGGCLRDFVFQPLRFTRCKLQRAADVLTVGMDSLTAASGHGEPGPSHALHQPFRFEDHHNAQGENQGSAEEL